MPETDHSRSVPGNLLLSSLLVLLCWFFLRKKVVPHFSVPEPVPASRSVPCGIPGRLLSFLVSSSANSASNALTLGNFCSPASSKAAFAALCRAISSRWASKNLFAVSRLTVGIIDRAGLGVVDDAGFQDGNLRQPRFCRLDGISQGMIPFRCRRCTFPQFLGAADFLLLQEQQSLRHLFQVELRCPLFVADAFALGHFFSEYPPATGRAVLWAASSGTAGVSPCPPAPL